jgi:hypothetical protein
MPGRNLHSQEYAVPSDSTGLRRLEISFPDSENGFLLQSSAILTGILVQPRERAVNNVESEAEEGVS